MPVSLYSWRDDRPLQRIPGVQSTFFPGGEPYVKLPYVDISGRYILVDARVGSMNDFGTLIAILDALSQIPCDVALLIPYFPGGRGDRINYQDGTALSVRMFAKMIEPFAVDRVIVLDAHSDVTAAVTKNCEVLSIANIFGYLTRTRPDLFPKYDAIICPDQGAEKRTADAAKALGIDRVINARKVRDMATGKLSGFDVDDFSDLLEGDSDLGSLLIVDDICDGGGTFAGLADLIHTRSGLNNETMRRGFNIDLWVTHAIMSAGPTALKGFRRVFCTDSYPTHQYNHKPTPRPRASDDILLGVNDRFEYPDVANDTSPGFTFIPIMPSLIDLVTERI